MSNKRSERLPTGDAEVGKMFGELRKADAGADIVEKGKWIEGEGDYDRYDVRAKFENMNCVNKYCNAFCAPFERTQKAFLCMRLDADSSWWWCRNNFLVPSMVTSGTSISLYIHLATWIMAMVYLVSGSMPINDAGGDRTIVKLFGAICSICPAVGIGVLLFAWIIIGQKPFSSGKKILPVTRFPLMQAILFWLFFSSLVAAASLVSIVHIQISSSLVLIPNSAGTGQSPDVTQKTADDLVLGMLFTIAGIGQLYGNLVYAVVHYATEEMHA